MATPRTVTTTSKMQNTKGQQSERLVTAPVRLPRNVAGQSKKGLGKPR